MSTTYTVLPPEVVLSASTVYASQGSIYALESSSGLLLRTYPVGGRAHLSVADERLYLNVCRHPDYLVQALRADDGSLLWTYRVEGRLGGDAPVVSGEIVYVSTVEGTIYALQVLDGSLLWRADIDLGPDVPTFLGPIVFASPTIGDGTLYLAPAVNAPLTPFLYAFRATDGSPLWKAELMDSSALALTVAGGVIYVNTHKGCSALRASDGFSIWQYQTNALICTAPIVLDEVVYLSLLEFVRHVDRRASSQMGPPRQQALLCALRAIDGSLLWQRQVGSATRAAKPTTPLVMQDAVYLGANNGCLSAFRASDGTPLWQYLTGGSLLSSPTGASGVVYVGTNTSHVCAVQASDGVPLWRTFVSVSLLGVSSITVTISQ